MVFYAHSVFSLLFGVFCSLNIFSYTVSVNSLLLFILPLGTFHISSPSIVFFSPFAYRSSFAVLFFYFFIFCSMVLVFGSMHKWSMHME